MESILNNIYKYASNRPKERFEMILDPLQAMIVLSIISFLPVGTKLHIHQNILYYQCEGWQQSFIRLYNNDHKQDLYFLFNVIMRYSTFYQHLKETPLFNLVLSLASNGIDKLIITYQSANDPTLTSMLNLYKVILNNPTKYAKDITITSSLDQIDTLKDIDKIFINIHKIYTENELSTLYYMLSVINQANAADISDHTRSLTRWLKPKCRMIRKWIAEHIVY